MRQFNKEFADEVFNIIPDADVVVVDTFFSDGNCYWAKKENALFLDEPQWLSEFIFASITYLGKVEISEEQENIIWRDNAVL